MASSESNPQAIRIVEPTDNHLFVLKLNELESILCADDIRDRHVAVISIVGTRRQGKSFLLNFFLHYLRAQYKVYDVTQFLNEESTDKIEGFSWRYGSRPDTTGILIWSEVFTHDLPDGKKVAIILMDTQGSFDSESSIRDCSTIFELSTMISSVLCYNVMRNIYEDHLQHFQLFTQYGQVCSEHSDEKPFQNLVFIVRDWSWVDDYAYGWTGGQEIVDDRLQSTLEETEKRRLRDQLRSSFTNIRGFLMPHPGDAVARTRDYDGNLGDISQEFKEMLKELIPKLLAPENLVIKRINGQEMRSSDLVHCLKSYLTVFNGSDLPEPQTLFEATVDNYYAMACSESKLFYVELMGYEIDGNEKFFAETEFEDLHYRTKIWSIGKLLKRPKYGGNEHIEKWMLQFKDDIEQEYIEQRRRNQEKKDNYIYTKLGEAKSLYVKWYCDFFKEKLSDTNLYFYESTMEDMHEEWKSSLINQLKMVEEYNEGNTISKIILRELQSELEKKFNEFMLENENKKATTGTVTGVVASIGITAGDAIAAALAAGPSTVAADASGSAMSSSCVASSQSKPQAVRIVEPTDDHLFELQINELESILCADDIRDRHVAVISIAGTLRQGKSFLLNFFLHYLRAQYKVHDVAQFLNEESTDIIEGFSWRYGSRPDTTGIMIWSEVFTHDFPDGKKVAIILMDTQGSFDNESSIRDCSTIFALSTMISSVLCYNVMRNISEDQLQHLHLFTQYGQICLDQSDEKPFQNLVFIVRDWSWDDENAYGWTGGQDLVDNCLQSKPEETEKQGLRNQLRSSFSSIRGFLMPHPGDVVARRRGYDGNLIDISLEFKEMLKELIPKLLAPENLVVKRINGQEMRSSDLVHCLKSYLTVFNRKDVPEPQTLFKATVSNYYSMACNDAKLCYIEQMGREINGNEKFFADTEFDDLHYRTKVWSIGKLQDRPKYGGNEHMDKWTMQFEDDIEQEYIKQKRRNQVKKDNYISTKLGDAKLLYVISYCRFFKGKLSSTNLYFFESTMKKMHEEWKTRLVIEFKSVEGYAEGGTVSENILSELQSELEIKFTEFMHENANMRSRTAAVSASAAAGVGIAGATLGVGAVAVAAFAAGELSISGVVAGAAALAAMAMKK